MAVTKRMLSAASGGRGITVTGATATGTIIHTAISGTTYMDEIWVWACNATGAAKKVTMEWARSTGAAGQKITYTVTGNVGPKLVIPGWPLQGGAYASSKQVRAYATGATTAITLHGYVHRIG